MRQVYNYLSKADGRVRVQHCTRAYPSRQSSPLKWGRGGITQTAERASIKSRSVTGRAFVDNADDILPPARTSVTVQFSLPPVDENGRSYQSFCWTLPRPTFARTNDKKSPSDIAFQHQDPAGSRSSDCGSTRKHRAGRRRRSAMDRTLLPRLRHGRSCPCTHLRRSGCLSFRLRSRRPSRSHLSNFEKFLPRPKNNLHQR